MPVHQVEEDEEDERERLEIREEMRGVEEEIALLYLDKWDHEARIREIDAKIEKRREEMRMLDGQLIGHV